MLRFGASRMRLGGDRYRPAYHYVNPEGNLNDPNGLCFWQGRFHLFYQAYPPEDTRQHWGHAVSDDLVWWEDLPLAIYPGIERACFSGSTLVEDNRVIAMYHGTRAGNMVAVASDPLLLNWQKIAGNPVIPMAGTTDPGFPYRVYDPCIWREPEGYYSISGSYQNGTFFGDCKPAGYLFVSQDLQRWSFLGQFIEGDIFTQPGEDGAVPYFWPMGDYYMLLFASHQRGSQYLIGDYDKVRHRFRPFAHGRLNFGAMEPGGVHAPTAMPDGEGGVYVIHNINAGRPTEGWNHIMSLPRHMTLDKDQALGIEPVAAIDSLRDRHQHVAARPLGANEQVVFTEIAGETMELAVKIDPQDAREICLHVLRSPENQEHTVIRFIREGYTQVAKAAKVDKQDALVLDNGRASLLADVCGRPPEIAPFMLAEGERLQLRVYVDRSVVEVFANGRQCLALRVYPSRKDSVGVSVSAAGSGAKLESLDAWQMKSIYQ